MPSQPHNDPVMNKHKFVATCCFKCLFFKYYYDLQYVSSTLLLLALNSFLDKFLPRKSDPGCNKFRGQRRGVCCMWCVEASSPITSPRHPRKDLVIYRHVILLCLTIYFHDTCLIGFHSNAFLITLLLILLQINIAMQKLLLSCYILYIL